MSIKEIIKKSEEDFDKLFVVHCSDGDILGTDKQNEPRKAKQFLKSSQLSLLEEVKKIIEHKKRLRFFTPDKESRQMGYNQALDDLLKDLEIEK